MKTSGQHLYSCQANLNQVGQHLVKSNSDYLQEQKFHENMHAKTFQQSICFLQKYFTEKSQPGVPATNTISSVVSGHQLFSHMAKAGACKLTDLQT